VSTKKRSVPSDPNSTPLNGFPKVLCSRARRVSDLDDIGKSTRRPIPLPHRASPRVGELGRAAYQRNISGQRAANTGASPAPRAPRLAGTLVPLPAAGRDGGSTSSASSELGERDATLAWEASR